MSILGCESGRLYVLRGYVSKGCESEGCAREGGCVQRVVSPRIVFLRGCMFKGHVSEGFDVLGGTVGPGAPVRVSELYAWSVSWSVLLSWDAPPCISSKPLYAAQCLPVLCPCPCVSLPQTCLCHDHPCVPVTAMTLTCPVGFELNEANAGPQLGP